ncbi:hypothetical protein HQ545_08935 [Candidatus Woesearchaeota archaeon]|nr:hypothetical protein [Candidatus Woesearchaeota archaeon]
MKRSKILICILYLFLVCNFAHAIGITGGDIDIETYFEPNSVFEFEFIGLTNRLHDNITYTAITKHGKQLTEYVHFEKKDFGMLPKASSAPIRGRIEFPEDLPPYIHKIHVCFSESCRENVGLCGRGVACASIVVYAPYDGIHPEASLSISDVNQGDDSTVKLDIKNTGDTTIGSCSAELSVFDLRDELKNKVNLGSTNSIESFGKDVLIVSFSTYGLPPGTYNTTANIICDDVELSESDMFRVGTLEVKIVNHTAKMLTGGIRKLTTTVESMWNDPVEVYAKVLMFNNESRIEGKSALVNLVPWEKKNAEVFIDTENLMSGKYDLVIELIYGDGKSMLQSEIILEDPQEPELGMPGSIKITVVIVIIIILLTFINIIITLKKRKK